MTNSDRKAFKIGFYRPPTAASSSDKGEKKIFEEIYLLLVTGDAFLEDASDSWKVENVQFIASDDDLWIFAR